MTFVLGSLVSLLVLGLPSCQQGRNDLCSIAALFDGMCKDASVLQESVQLLKEEGGKKVKNDS